LDRDFPHVIGDYNSADRSGRKQPDRASDQYPHHDFVPPPLINYVFAVRSFNPRSRMLFFGRIVESRSGSAFGSRACSPAGLDPKRRGRGG
jgi:hypothetical protein